MNELSNYTPTELTKFINDIDIKHSNLKTEILSLLDTHDNMVIELEDLRNNINKKSEFLKELEENYVMLIDEYNKR